MTTTSPAHEANPDPAEPADGQREAHWLNLPNLITISRLVLAVVLFYLITIPGWWKTAAVLFAVAAGTDFLDGFIARRYGLVTALGRILDPFADKFIICGTFVFLLAAKTSDNQPAETGVTAFIVIVVLAREMFVTSLRGYLEQQGRDFSASLSGKIKMVVQCAAVPMSLLSLTEELKDVEWFRLARDVTIWTAVLVTVFSGVFYAVRAITMVKAEDPPQPAGRAGD